MLGQLIEFVLRWLLWGAVVVLETLRAAVAAAWTACVTGVASLGAEIASRAATVLLWSAGIGAAAVVAACLLGARARARRRVRPRAAS